MVVSAILSMIACDEEVSLCYKDILQISITYKSQ